MKQVLVYVEGQTEETFVRDVLAPHLFTTCSIFVIPTLARTKRTKSGQTFKGGIVSYGQVKKDLRNLLNTPNVALVTTMIDYYGLPDDFPGISTLPTGTLSERVRALQDAFAMDIGSQRFLPFLVLHEFEALVLTEPEHLADVLPQYKAKLADLQRDINGLPPEEINDGDTTHPAARIRQYFPGYQKRLHGPLLFQKIGIETIRDKCPHFHDWLTRLESLCTQQE